MSRNGSGEIGLVVFEIAIIVLGAIFTYLLTATDDHELTFEAHTADLVPVEVTLEINHEGDAVEDKDAEILNQIIKHRTRTVIATVMTIDGFDGVDEEIKKALRKDRMVIGYLEKIRDVETNIEVNL